MTNFMKGINFGKGTGSDASGPENPGAQWDEVWNTPDYTDPNITYSRYNKPYTSLEENIGEDRLTRMSPYRQAKIENRSEVLAERGLNKLSTQEEKIISTQGSKLSKRQLRLLGKNNFEKAMKIARRKNKVKNFFNR